MDIAAAAKRMDAIKLAKGSKWDELKRLVDAEPLTAQQTDSYGMLPLHWACTEPHSIGEGVLMALLKAFPQGARGVNTAEMVPLQIAIKAQAKIEWLQALLASYPDAVLKKTPTGENAVELARKSNLPPRSVRLLEEMYHHVCQKAGYSSDHLYDDEEHHHDGGDVGIGGGSASAASIAAAGFLPSDKTSISSLRTASSGESLQRYPSTDSTGGGGANGVAVGARAGSAPLRPGARRPSNPDKFKVRTYSDNDFQPGPGPESMYRPTDMSIARGVSTSSNGSGSGGSASNGPGGVSISKPLPYQVSTQLSSRTVVSLPPRWTNAPNCHICSQKFSTFGTFRKRHHCRNCGQSICSDHSARERMRLPHYGLPDRYRVCTVCLTTLKTAGRELLQPSQGRLTTVLPARRSDEAVPRFSGQAGGNFHLERHVSAPARSLMDTEYQGIHHQVASLQKQVSQLMEEKELAESQLRAQAELLGESYNPERLTAMGRRDRLNSVPIKMPSTGVTPPKASLTVDSSHFVDQEPGYSAFGAGQRVSRPKTNSYDFRERDVDDHRTVSMSSAVPEPPTSTESGTAEVMAQLQDDMGNMSFMSSYSEFDDRPTDIFDDGDDHIEADRFIHEQVLEEGDEDAEAYDDDEGDEGDSTLPEVEVLVNLGLAMLNKGSSSAAVQAFTRSIEICPDSAILYSYLAKAYYADENLDEAVYALETSLELEPSAANSTLLGKILFEKGDHEKAIAAYQKSLEFQNASA